MGHYNFIHYFKTISIGEIIFYWQLTLSIQYDLAPSGGEAYEPPTLSQKGLEKCFANCHFSFFPQFLSVVTVQFCLFSSLVSVPGWQHTWIRGYRRQSQECFPSWEKRQRSILFPPLLQLSFRFYVTHLVVTRALWLAEPSTVSIHEAPRRTYIGCAPGNFVEVHSHVFPIIS